MKVFDLIRSLSECPPHADVVIDTGLDDPFYLSVQVVTKQLAAIKGAGYGEVGKDGGCCELVVVVSP